MDNTGTPGSLSAEQRRAVEHRDGPLLVLGGPGTGKSTVLLEHVLSRVGDGLALERVLALSVDRRAAASLRTALARRLMPPTPGEPARAVRAPVARSLHSYAFAILRRALLAAGEPPPRLITGPEHDLMLRELLAGEVEEFGAQRWPEHLRPALGTRELARQLRDLLHRAESRGVDPRRLAALGRAHGRPEWVAAAEFAAELEDSLALRPPPRAYDAAGLVAAAVRLLGSDEQLLTAERSRCGLLVLDDAQDLDPAQWALVRLLVGEAGPLVAAADPDQAVLGFRGGDLGRLRQVRDRATVITLGRSWRLPDSVAVRLNQITPRLGGAWEHRVLSGRSEDVDLPGAPTRPPAAALDLAVFADPDDELAHVAAWLRRAHLLEEVPWEEMAILVRSSAALPRVRRTLRGAGVPLRQLSEDAALARQPAARAMLVLLALVCRTEPTSDEIVTEVLAGPVFGLDALVRRRLRARAGSWEAVLEEAEETGVDELTRLRNTLAAGEAAMADGGDVEQVMWAVWAATGCAQSWSQAALAEDRMGVAARQNLDAVVDLFAVAARFGSQVPGAGVKAFLDHVADQQVRPEPRRGAAAGEVALLTASAARGLAWRRVVVLGVQESAWPDLRQRDTLLGADLLSAVSDEGALASPTERATALLAEERRLFLVAVSRASEATLVTAVNGEADRPSRFLDEVDPRPPGTGRAVRPPMLPLDLSAFVASLRRRLLEQDGGADSDEVARTLAWLAEQGVPGADPSQWHGLGELSTTAALVDGDQPVVVSPSRVEEYRRCPLRWMLVASGGRGPSSSGQEVGVLIHDLARMLGDGTLRPEDVFSTLELRWTQTQGRPGWVGRRERARAEAMVTRLLDWMAANPRHVVGVEVPFDVRVDGTRLVGRVDRLELDVQGRLVVVDLKTGRAKLSRGEVESHPQLGIYQVAASAGAFDEVVDDGRPVEGFGPAGKGDPGGAALVHLGLDRSEAVEQLQPSIRPDLAAREPSRVAQGGEDVPWPRAMLREVAVGMAGSVFEAVAGSWCRTCPVRRACPAHPESGLVSAEVQAPAGSATGRETS